MVCITVAPDAMHHVKTYRKDIRNMHCVAPEYGGKIHSNFIVANLLRSQWGGGGLPLSNFSMRDILRDILFHSKIQYFYKNERQFITGLIRFEIII